MRSAAIHNETCSSNTLGAQIVLRRDGATKPARCFRVHKSQTCDAHSHCRLVRLPSASGRVPDSWLETKLLCLQANPPEVTQTARETAHA